MWLVVPKDDPGPVTQATNAPGTAAEVGGGVGGGGGAPTRQFTDAELRAALDSHTGALTRHNQSGFLSALDQSNKKLLADQRRLYANLSQLDLAVFRYVPVETYLPPPDPGSKSGYGKGWTYVWRQVQVRGIDPKPSAQYYRLRLTGNKDHKIVITAVETAQGAGVNRHPIPWDVATLTMYRSGPVVVAGTADVADELAHLANTARRAIEDAGEFWPRTWQRSFLIFATGDRKQFNTWFRSRFTNTDFIGFQVALPVIGGDGKVVNGLEQAIPMVVIDVPGALDAPLGFRQLLEHELTHAASAAERNPETQTWAIEGYADFVAFHSGTLREANRGGLAYRKYHGEGGLTVRLPTNNDFYGKDAALHYDLSFLCLWYMGERWGQRAVIDWFVAANKGGDATAELKRRFHITPDAYVRDWAAWTFKVLD